MGVTPRPRSYGPLRHPLLFDRFPGSAGYTAYLAPPVSRREEEGFSSCLVCPGHRAAAPTPPEDHTVSASIRWGLLPSPSQLQARPPGRLTFGATSAFACAAARWLAVILRWRCRWASGPWFPSSLSSSYRASGFCPGGPVSRWTRQPFLDAQPNV